LDQLMSTKIPKQQNLSQNSIFLFEWKIYP
jgi:hypothetical protein